MKSIVISIIFAFLLFGCETSFDKKIEVKTGEQSFLCEVAINDFQRKQGLMFREKLAENAGMLFDLQTPKTTGFWMKNTLIPLDIIWIDSEKKIVSIVTANPCTKKPCKIFEPPSPARWVLEVNAGKFEGDIGNEIEFE